MSLTPEKMERTAGILVIAAAALIAIGVLFNLYNKGVFEAKLNIHAFRPQATGITPGAIVTFRGIPIGKITRVNFSPKRLHTQKPIRVELVIKEKMAAIINTDFRLAVPATSALTAGFVTGSLELMEPKNPDPKATRLKENDELQFEDAKPGVDQFVDLLVSWWLENSSNMGELLRTTAAISTLLADPQQPFQQTFTHIEALVAALSTEKDKITLLLHGMHEVVASIQEEKGLAGAVFMESGLKIDVKNLIKNLQGSSQNFEVLTQALADNPEQIPELFDILINTLNSVYQGLEIAIRLIEHEGPEHINRLKETLEETQTVLKSMRKVTDKLGLSEEPPKTIAPITRQPRVMPK